MTIFDSIFLLAVLSTTGTELVLIGMAVRGRLQGAASLLAERVDRQRISKKPIHLYHTRRKTASGR